MKKNKLKQLRREEKDQAFIKKALIKVINQKNDEIKNEIRDPHFFDEVYSEEKCIFYYDNLKEFGERTNANLKYKSIAKKGTSFKYKTNMMDFPSQGYIQLISDKCFLKLINFVDNEDIKIHVIDSGIGGDWPKAKCIHYEKMSSDIEMLQDYQPAHVLFYPVNPNDVLDGYCALGIYLLDDDYNFLCKRVIEIFDDKIASADCKNLRIPKRASELLEGV